MPKKPSALEQKFLAAWERHGFGDSRPPVREFVVDQEPFAYPFDFAWPDFRLLVEIDGHGMGHTLPKYRERDATKARNAMVLGWTVLRFTGNCLSNEEKRQDAANMVLYFMGDRDEREAERLVGRVDHYGDVGRFDVGDGSG